MARSRSRSRWIASLCGSAVVAGGLAAASFFLSRTETVSTAAARVPRFLRMPEEMRLSQASIDAFTASLELTGDQRARVQSVLQALRAHDQEYQRKRTAAVNRWFRSSAAASIQVSSLMANPWTRGMATELERLKMEWRRREIRAGSESLQRMDRENDLAVRRREAKATEEIRGTLTDRQRQRLPLFLQTMRNLKSVGLPVSFCTEVLRNPRQRQAIASVAAETEKQRRRIRNNYAVSAQSANGAKDGPGGIQAGRLARQQIFIKTYEDIRRVNSTAYKRSLETLSPAQRRVIRRSGAHYTP